MENLVIILKRKLYEGVSYPQSRIQLFRPSHNNSVVAGTITDFAQFVSESFTQEGSYIEDVKNFPKNPGDKKKNCKYCPHKKVSCDQKQELV